MNPVYRTSPQLITRAAAVAFGLAIAIGVLWGFMPIGIVALISARAGVQGFSPDWSFWFAIGGAFIITEAIVRATGAKRGRMYQLIGMGAVFVCIVISRVILAHRVGVDFARISDVLGSARIDSPQARVLFRQLSLNLPNIVYSGLALAIPYFRFR
jgi:hypothetical protein